MPYHSPRWDSRWQALYRAAIFEQTHHVPKGLLLKLKQQSRSAGTNSPKAQGRRPMQSGKGSKMLCMLLKALRTAQNVSSAA